MMVVMMMVVVMVVMGMTVLLVAGGLRRRRGSVVNRRARSAQATIRQHEALGSSLQHASVPAAVDSPIKRSLDPIVPRATVVAGGGGGGGGDLDRSIGGRFPRFPIVQRDVRRAFAGSRFTGTDAAGLLNGWTRFRDDLEGFRAADRWYPYVLRRAAVVAQRPPVPKIPFRARTLRMSILVQPLCTPVV